MRRQFLSPRVFGVIHTRQLITSCVKSRQTANHDSANQFSENSVHASGNNEHKIDEPHHDYIDTSQFQRFILSVGSSVAALVNPHR